MSNTELGLALNRLVRGADEIGYLQNVLDIYQEHRTNSPEDLSDGIIYAAKNGLVDRSVLREAMDCKGQCFSKLECGKDDHSFDADDFKNGYQIVVDVIDSSIKDQLQSLTG